MTTAATATSLPWLHLSAKLHQRLEALSHDGYSDAIACVASKRAGVQLFLPEERPDLADGQRYHVRIAAKDYAGRLIVSVQPADQEERTL